MNKILVMCSVILLLSLSACSSFHEADEVCNKTPRIFPDYSGITLPANIAPINFEIHESASAYEAIIGCGDDAPIMINSTDSIISIPIDEWHSLLEKAKGKDIFIRVLLEQDGKWIQYKDIINNVANSDIDPVLAYRLLYPGYEFWDEMGIYQRNLTSFEETAIVENKDFGGQCVNCHSFANRDSKTMMLHVRGKSGGTIIARDGNINKVNPQPESFPRGATYPYWSADGRYIVFSSNDVHQYFHQAGKKKIEVSDFASDLIIYDVEKNETFTDSLVFGNDYMETFPCFTPDGKTIYFCRADAYKEGMPLDSIRYGLYAIDFDVQNHCLSNLRCIVDAPKEGHSVSFPRVSPDGKWLIYTQSDYGNFSIWHAEADLWLLNIATGETRLMTEVNSNDVDSYHSWSSNGEWFVFSSKRMDGLWARPFIAHFDSTTGKASRPFLLPQENPQFYNNFTRTFNIPELVKGEIANGKEIINAINKQEAQRATEKR